MPNTCPLGLQLYNDWFAGVFVSLSLKDLVFESRGTEGEGDLPSASISPSPWAVLLSQMLTRNWIGSSGDLNWCLHGMLSITGTWLNPLPQRWRLYVISLKYRPTCLGIIEDTSVLLPEREAEKHQYSNNEDGWEISVLMTWEVSPEVGLCYV